MLKQIKDYKILTLIGKGSYGAVYKALNTINNKHYAMKVYTINSGNTADILAIENEIKIISTWRNDYIVRYYDSFKHESYFCMVMEWCEYGDWFQLIKKNREKNQYFSEENIKKYFSQICKGWQYLHRNSIWHRDLKTLNIFITKDSNAKIGDFGVAKKLLNNNRFAYTLVGTPYYLSPELCSEKPYDEKSDIWSWGCIWYEMVTLQKPFESTNQFGWVMKIIKEPPIPLKPEVLKLYSEKLVDIIYGLLNKNPIQRWSLKLIMKSGLFDKDKINIIKCKTNTNGNKGGNNENKKRRNERIEKKYERI